MNRQIVARLGKLFLISVFCWSAPLSVAQEIKPYRLDFSLNEMDDGKKINSRQYSMYLNAADPHGHFNRVTEDPSAKEIKIGERVAVETGQGQFQYLEVATRIKAGIMEQENGLLLDVTSDISRIADPEKASPPGSMPMLRQMNINASTVAGLGKPTVIGSVDDPGSKRQYQIEVTATKLK